MKDSKWKSTGRLWSDIHDLPFFWDVFKNQNGEKSRGEFLEKYSGKEAS